MSELKIVTMSEVTVENINWLWKPYIPYGKISIIQGDGGNGKTTLSLVIAAAVTIGGTLPGCGEITPSHVIIQNAEDGIADTIKPRLEQRGANIKKIHFIDDAEQPVTLFDKRIEEIIIKKKAKLCILDPIQAFFGTASMNAANSVRPIMKQLGNVAARTGCAILLVGHLGKKGGKSQYRGLGSIDIYAAARSVLTVGKIEYVDEDLRAMVHNKSNLAAVGASQSFEINPVNGFAWAGECDIDIDELLDEKKKSKPQSQSDKARQLIETAFADGSNGAEEIMQMAVEQGVSESTMNRIKTKMGIISVKHSDKWFWEYHQSSVSAKDSQDAQDSHAPNMTTLTAFREKAVK